MPKQHVAITCILLCFLFPDCKKTDFSIRILESGVYNMHQGHDLVDEPGRSVPVEIPIEILNPRSGQVELSVTAEDMWGLPVVLDKNRFFVQAGEILEGLLSAFYVSQQDEIGQGHNSNVNASKAVHYTIFSALHGAYQTNIQWRLGFGPEWTRSNSTLAVCSYFLEDRPVIADIWPESSLIYGAVFANPEHIDYEILSLKRSGELISRWEEPVPENTEHKDLKVAVVFSLTGPGPDSLDTHGTITIPEARHIRAFDCTGREIYKHASKLIIPLNEYPVYLIPSGLALSWLITKERVPVASFSGRKLPGYLITGSTWALMPQRGTRIYPVRLFLA